MDYLERRLDHAQHDRQTELLADPLASEVVKYLSVPTDRHVVALLVYLEKRKRHLQDQMHRLIEQWNPASDELVIVVPEYEIPFPKNLDEITFLGMHVRRAPDGDELPCRVALEGARFPANMTPTWVGYVRPPWGR